MHSLIQKQGPSEAPSPERQEGRRELGTTWAEDDLLPTEGQGRATLGEGPGPVGSVRQWSLLPCGISGKISAAHVRWLKGAVFCVNADISSNRGTLWGQPTSGLHLSQGEMRGCLTERLRGVAADSISCRQVPSPRVAHPCLPAHAFHRCPPTPRMCKLPWGRNASSRLVAFLSEK